jgi:hypothetical protein
MVHLMLIDGNNLGHALGYMEKATDRYNSADLLACLDGVARHLSALGQNMQLVLFMDDPSFAERLGGWFVHVHPVPGGDADVAIRAYARAHADRTQTLVSADQDLCASVALWGVRCLSPDAFVSGYVVPARDAGWVACYGNEPDREHSLHYVETSEAAPAQEQDTVPPPDEDQGKRERRRQREALDRAQAALEGKTLPPPEVYRLDLERWHDPAELALYLAQNHLCPAHPHLTDPQDMIAAIREHCSLQPRYFTSGQIIDRVFRLFLCRPERTLSLDNLARLAETRRRKIRAVIEKYGERLGIKVKW